MQPIDIGVVGKEELAVQRDRLPAVLAEPGQGDGIGDRNC